MRFSPRRKGRCTTGKICWATKYDAQLALGSAHSSIKLKKPIKRWYKCNLCRYYHLTSQEYKE